jgi:hypothetical protein
MPKRICIVIIALLCLSFATPTLADEFGIGSGWFNGHSDTGDYAMMNEGGNPWGFVLHYDYDAEWLRKFDKVTFGIDPGMMYTYVHWTKNHNKTREVCEDKWCYEEPRYECDFEPICQYEECTEEEYRDNESINSHILGAYLKPYVDFYGKVRLFTLFGPGLEIADDYIQEAVVMGGGIQYRWTKSIATSLTQYEIFSSPFDDYRRFDATVFSIDILF